MTTISITNLKMNPALAIASAQDFPVAIQNRNDTEAYLIGKGLFEKMILYLEDIEDKKTIKNINMSDKRNFEDFASELGL
ncbi:MAG: Prevent-host-death protein [Candidatus Woesebacteria bacterium GW2011_GWA1_33_30]|uniref:Prevent-host-death protein n=1 Tax=Candidatus Woesebacteria bacterium GW2011_GWA2_33_28 TaxID=1618561 RepID=A0A0G0A8N6_9BACT|nr:MAG: Prevent-host-death protein [Candidatus Woesebacteria bacterium GW2011_GWA2_33_28]KKP48489.1 MAG: Prevent-host-death protein [Candidatus Woesebacteria bacterium GW2011_GWA1_33_30]KKP49627.1 MAG: Prevent-host-death protein [Microgenomates group bacterium GW2011_GWC1_33_32]KKP52244.1 MAG: Prevent-host-death protein [Candidatus Woesebacteria bacterium GW2011_GWB1_33_38]KKP58079.1 MAG: Prevent-host-death protein [Microgenomates group bacterium GW2011_GWD1_33_9]